MKILIRFSALFFILLAASAGLAQTTSFTYQGRLTEANNPANGSYDLQFALFDAASGGTQIGGSGATQTLSAVAVTGGVFTVQLDFGGNAFPGANRFLEISVRTAGTGTFTVLAPRQQISSTPYAIRTLSAASADTATTATNAQTATNATQLGGVAASQYVQTTDARLTDARQPVAGSNNYIQNTTAPQASANFNVSGNGTIGGNLNVGGALSLNIVNANTQYNLGGSRVLSSPGTNNLFVGLNTAATGPTGIDNSYFGNFAGNASTTGDANSFFGVSAGFNNQGTANSFFGRSAGFQNTIGDRNSFFGVQAGRDNTDGFQNSFFGWQAGIGNGGGERNSFFGAQAGLNNTGGGGRNSFFGANAGGGNTTGSFNSFFGERAGDANTIGSSNTAIGTGASFASPNLFNATAIGAFARVATDFTMVLGNPNAGINVVIGANGSGNGFNNTRAARLNVFGGPLWTSNGWKAAIQIEPAAAIGWNGLLSPFSFGIGQSIGGLYFFRTPAYIGNTVFDAEYDLVITDDGRIGIWTTTPDMPLTVNGGASKPGGGSWANFSDERLKDIKGRYTTGLKAIMQLQPLRYEYKPDNALGLKSAGEHIGFGAQAVAKVIPEAVMKNDQGYLLLNNDPIIWAAINAVKEQQNQIETLRLSNARLQSRLRAVEKQLRKRTGPSRRRR